MEDIKIIFILCFLVSIAKSRINVQQIEDPYEIVYGGRPIFAGELEAPTAPAVVSPDDHLISEIRRRPYPFSYRGNSLGYPIQEKWTAINPVYSDNWKPEGNTPYLAMSNRIAENDLKYTIKPTLIKPIYDYNTYNDYRRPLPSLSNNQLFDESINEYSTSAYSPGLTYQNEGFFTQYPNFGYPNQNEDDSEILERSFFGYPRIDYRTPSEGEINTQTTGGSIAKYLVHMSDYLTYADSNIPVDDSNTRPFDGNIDNNSDRYSAANNLFLSDYLSYADPGRPVTDSDSSPFDESIDIYPYHVVSTPEDLSLPGYITYADPMRPIIGNTQLFNGNVNTNSNLGQLNLDNLNPSDSAGPYTPLFSKMNYGNLVTGYPPPSQALVGSAARPTDGQFGSYTTTNPFFEGTEVWPYGNTNFVGGITEPLYYKGYMADQSSRPRNDYGWNVLSRSNFADSSMYPSIDNLARKSFWPVDGDLFEDLTDRAVKEEDFPYIINAKDSSNYVTNNADGRAQFSKIGYKKRFREEVPTKTNY